MFDYDKSEKFDKRANTLSREIYITPDFDKFHREICELTKRTGLKDIYTTKRVASYIGGRFVTFDSIFHYELDAMVSPENEEEVKNLVFEAVSANVQKTILDKDQDPSEFIMIIKFIDLAVDLDDNIKDVMVRSAFYNFIKDEQVVL